MLANAMTCKSLKCLVFPISSGYNHPTPHGESKQGTPWCRRSSGRLAGRVAKARIRSSRCASKHVRKDVALPSSFYADQRFSPSHRFAHGLCIIPVLPVHKKAQKAGAGWFPLGSVSWPIWPLIFPQTVSSLKCSKHFNATASPRPGNLGHNACSLHLM
jgi:hypothetical protein